MVFVNKFKYVFPLKFYGKEMNQLRDHKKIPDDLKKIPYVEYEPKGRSLD